MSGRSLLSTLEDPLDAVVHPPYVQREGQREVDRRDPRPARGRKCLLGVTDREGGVQADAGEEQECGEQVVVSKSRK